MRRRTASARFVVAVLTWLPPYLAEFLDQRFVDLIETLAG
jgi:hypothetical protein